MGVSFQTNKTSKKLFFHNTHKTPFVVCFLKSFLKSFLDTLQLIDCQRVTKE